MTGRAAYGPIAAHVAHCIPADAPAIVFDHSGIAAAIRDALQRRGQGEDFLLRAVLPREWTLRVDSIASALLMSFASMDERRVAAEMAWAGTLNVNNRPIAELDVYPNAFVRLLSGLVRMASAVVVSSEAERRRITELSISQPRFVRPDLRDPLTPAAQARAMQRDAIVIWAPHLTGDAAATFAVALSGLRDRVIVVSHSAPSVAGPAEWMSPDHGAEALRRARLIIDAASHGCETALALASWRVPMICDVESGAQESIAPIRTYDRRRLDSVLDAAVSALGIGAPEVHTVKPDPLSVPQNDHMVDGPLVSVIVPTYNRPDMLRDALESIQSQSYKNIETIVVNDAGEPIEDVVARFPRTKLLNMKENLTYAAVNAAFNETAGTYVTCLNDDDIYFRDHIASLVTALERANADVANTDLFTAFLRSDGTSWSAYGVESNMSRSVDYNALLVSNQVGMISVMYRRTCINDATIMDPEIPFFRDYGLWLRLATQHDFVHVDRVTCCYTIRNRGAGQASTLFNDRALSAYQAIYARYPVEGRPLLLQRRAAMLQSVEAGHMGLNVEPAAQIAPLAWPPWSRD